MSVNLSYCQAKREEKIKAAHDEAMFGGSSHPPPVETYEEPLEEGDEKQNTECAPVASLLSNQVTKRTTYIEVTNFVAFHKSKSNIHTHVKCRSIGRLS